MPEDVLTTLASRLGSKPAVIEDPPGAEERRLDFAALERECNRLANALRDAGIERGDRVVWCGQNSLGVVRMLHAARKIGAAAVPLNYRLTAEEAAYVIDHCDAVLVYADAEFAPLMAESRPGCPGVREWWSYGGPPGPDMRDAEAAIAAASDAAPPAPPDGTPPAVTITYTSGTTGRPKGAVRRGLGDPEQVRLLLEHIGYEPDDVYLTTGPLYHSGPGGFMLLSQTMGHTVVIQRRFDPEDWLRLVDRHRVTTTFSAPTPIRLVCRLPEEVKARYDRSSMRRMIANAAPWSQALKEMYLDDFPEDSLWEVYGSTELGVNTILAPADQRARPGSCGKPAPAVEVALFDDDGKRVAEPRVPGELFVRSKTVFDTYYKQHEKYEEDRRDDFQTVGDMAYFDEDGFFYICDRKKDMIISGGMNIYPAEIEAALEHHAKIADVAVFGIPSEDWGESVHAVVVAAPGAELAEADVVAFAREHLAGYKIPRSISFAAEIPRTGSGKILKRTLRAPYWENA